MFFLADVIGVCSKVGEVVKFKARTGRECIKREVTLIDSSNASIKLVLWGKEAEDLPNLRHPVLLLKDAFITQFMGSKALSISNGALKINPDCAESRCLRDWFDSSGSNIGLPRPMGPNTNTKWMTLYEAKNLGIASEPEYFQLRGTVQMIKATNLTYKACPAPRCLKKVIPKENGLYHCDKCNTEQPSFIYKMILNVSVTPS